MQRCHQDILAVLRGVDRLAYICATVESPGPPVPLVKSMTQLVEITVFWSVGRRVFASRISLATIFVSPNKASSGRSPGLAGNGASSESGSDQPRAAFGTYSNREQSARGGVNVLLLDQMDTDWRKWALGWPQVIRFFHNLTPADHIAVYSLDAANGLRVVQDYRDDTGALLSRIKRMLPAESGDALATDRAD